MRCATMVAAFVVLASAAGGCSSEDNPPPAPAPLQTGQSCTAASECYPGVDAGALSGQVTCLTQVSGGYCTHVCQADTDCCALQGECVDGRPELCGPFESTSQNFCFLSCEPDVVTAAGMTDANVYCATYANANFTFRSTGGGATNRKICAQ